MRRRRKEVPNTAQQSLPMRVAESSVERAADSRRPRFTQDSPQHLFIGDQRLDKYLEGRGLSWVVRLRRELERLDYSALEGRYQRTGRNPFHPRTMLGLIVYGIIEGQWSLRSLESLAARDVGAWWICGGHQPDHSTIGDFIHRHAEILTREFVGSLVQSLVSRMRLQAGVVAIDGSVVEAAASHYRRLTIEAAQAAADKARQAAEEDPGSEQLQAAVEKAEQAVQAATERTDRRKRQGKPSDKVVVSAREPQAVLQPRKDGAMRFSYKPSTLVHESGLIIGQALHPSSETAVVDELMEQHADIFGTVPKAALLDAGYCQTAVLESMVERGANVLCPSGRTDRSADWEKKGHNGLFGKSRFTYDAERDVYECPAGAELKQTSQSRDANGRLYQVYTTRMCAGCELRPKCTTIRKGGRRIKRYEGEEFKEAMAQVLRQPAARLTYRLRSTLAERPFAELRERQGLRRFHRCGLAGAAVEFAMHVIAFNLKWAIRHGQTSNHGHIGVLALLYARVGGPSAPWRLVAVRAWTSGKS